MCEEACPEDAIYLEKTYELSDYQRDAFIYTKEEMLVGPEKNGYLPER
jgi:formate hydrogenlyase subunit 6/NADH:ubiquinone oxidoreductase subunit I